MDRTSLVARVTTDRARVLSRGVN